MATAAEQWVLVEMVQALYEVGSADREAHEHPGPGEGETARVDMRSEASAGLTPSRPNSALLAESCPSGPA